MRAKVGNPGIGMTSKPRNLLSDWILIIHDQTFTSRMRISRVFSL